MVAVAQREEDISKYFGYEVTAEPTALFKEGVMRKPAKPQLRRALTDGTSDETQPLTDQHVLDGGALIHKVRWVKGETYKQTAMRYIEYVRKKFEKCCIVFDGYGMSCTTKDHEHQRRSTRETFSNITISDENTAYSNQEAFLANNNNKEQLILLLTKYLRAANNTVINCSENADAQIALQAMDFARLQRSVTVVADDTDIFLLLVSHMEDQMADIYFMSETAKKTWRSIRKIINSMEPVVKKHILFLHAWTGCDTTSSIYGQGKTSLIKKIKSSRELQRHAEIISNPWAEENEVVEAGENIFIIMYGGKFTDTLNTFW